METEYRNNNTGELFVHLSELYNDFCNRQSCCRDCPLYTKDHTDCRYFLIDDADEALKHMNVSKITNDQEDSQFPFALCDILHKDIYEEWKINNTTYRINSDGIIEVYTPKTSMFQEIDCADLCKAINDPNTITSDRAWTLTEIEDAKTLLNFFYSNNHRISRYDDGSLYFEYANPNTNKYVLIDLNSRLFPSLRAGEVYYLEDIVNHIN